ncbi:hypothetical protein GCM10007350_00060 [Jeongeupia chitinilytica]|uniref:ATPase AAA-type core domain-containing protein n=1 Tax=Jeongeupia chitinilytica TaxID=1041641 RepID=A0ABQ3GWR2_9NEIS|nr:hypothetical protein GCM10007350_00060 [Jeongeupia chitinilytica]
MVRPPALSPALLARYQRQILALDGTPRHGFAGTATQLRPAVVVADGEGVRLADPAKLAARLHVDPGRGLAHEALARLGEAKPLRIATAADLDILEALAHDTPSLTGLLAPLAQRVKLQVFQQQALHLGVHLLLGPPGNGKSWLCHQLAEKLALPLAEFQLGGSGDTLLLLGSSRHWSGSGPGELVRFLAGSPIANPLLLFEEVDKTGGNQHGRVADVLLMLAEPENARRFEDKYLAVPVDFSHCSLLLTANDAAPIDAPLRSRCRATQIAPPTAAEWPALVQHVYRSVLKQQQLDGVFAATLPDALLAPLLRNCSSIRALRLRLEAALAAAVDSIASAEEFGRLKGTLLPMPVDIAAPHTGRIGFV